MALSQKEEQSDGRREEGMVVLPRNCLRSLIYYEAREKNDGLAR